MGNHPVHRLATELLGHIFSFCPSSFDDFRKSPDETDWENGAVALRVSHVSCYWRAVSHAIISPWLVDEGFDEYGFAYDGFVDDLLKPRVERVEHYLGLSGKLPLRIVLCDLPSCDVDGWYDAGGVGYMKSLIDPLVGEIHRWELFYANLQPEYFTDILDLTGPMPFLTELHLKVDGSDSCDVELPTETPKLERLAIYGLELCHKIEDLPCFAPNSALRYISVGGIPLNKVAPIIHAASANMAVELEDIHSLSSLGSEEPITCSSHTLSIGTTGPVSKVLVKLRLASSVNTLEFCCEKAWEGPFPLVSFKGMLSRSSSTEITNLTLRFWYISDTHLLNLLAALSCLTHLTIEEYAKAQSQTYRDHYLPPPFSSAFFDVLAYSEHNNDSMTFTDKYDRHANQEWWLDYYGEQKPFDVSLCPLLPRLTDLVLVFHLSSIAENAVKMIESRIRPASEGIARLQSVCIHYYGDHLVDETTRFGLEKLGGKEGLKLEVKQLIS